MCSIGVSCGLSKILSKALILRIALGGMLFLHAISKLKMGTDVFVDTMSKGFENTLLSMGFVKGFLWVVPYYELVVSVLLILGLFTALAGRLAALLFACFVVGMTALSVSGANGNAVTGIVGNFIFMYAAFKLVCCHESMISLDHLLWGSCESK